MSTPFEIFLQIPSLIASTLQIIKDVKAAINTDDEENRFKTVEENLNKILDKLLQLEKCSKSVGEWKDIHNDTQILLFIELKICFESAKSNEPIYSEARLNVVKKALDTTLGYSGKAAKLKSRPANGEIEMPEDSPFTGSNWPREIYERIKMIEQHLENENFREFKNGLKHFHSDLVDLNCIADQEILNWVGEHKKFIDDLAKEISAAKSHAN